MTLTSNTRSNQSSSHGVSPQSLGEAAALAIATGRPALLILASRTPSKLEAIAERVREVVLGQGDPATTSGGAQGAAAPGASGGTVVATVVLDQSSLAATRQGAGEIAARTGRLDIILNNAGVCVNTRQTSADEFELTWAVNHLGAFLPPDHTTAPATQEGGNRERQPRLHTSPVRDKRWAQVVSSSLP